jgi:hypothetical protein
MTDGYVTSSSYNCLGFETEIWGAGIIVLKRVFPFTIYTICGGRRDISPRVDLPLKLVKDTEDKCSQMNITICETTLSNQATGASRVLSRSCQSRRDRQTELPPLFALSNQS